MTKSGVTVFFPFDVGVHGVLNGLVVAFGGAAEAGEEQGTVVQQRGVGVRVSRAGQPTTPPHRTIGRRQQLQRLSRHVDVQSQFVVDLVSDPVHPALHIGAVTVFTEVPEDGDRVVEVVATQQIR